MALPRKRGQYVKYLRTLGNSPIPRSTWHRWLSQDRISSEKLAELGIYRSKRKWKRKDANDGVTHGSAAVNNHEVDEEESVQQRGMDCGHSAAACFAPGTATSPAGEEEDLYPYDSSISSDSNISDNFSQSSSGAPSVLTSDSDTASVSYSSGEFSDVSSVCDTVGSASKKKEEDIKFSKHIGFEVLNQPLCNFISTTKFEALLMIFHIALRFGFTQDFLTYQLKFVNKLLGVDALTESCYLFQKLFMFTSSPEVHFYCPQCSIYLGTTASFPEMVNCKKCNSWSMFSSSNNGGFYFITLSVRKQIENVLNRPDIEFVSQEPSADSLMSDIKDGVLYQELLKNAAVGPDVLTITFNTDGCPVFNSGPNTLWPIQFLINEIHPTQRFNSENILLAGLWFGKHDPIMSVFLQPFVEELEELSQSGIVWEKPNGKVVESRVYALCCCTDSAARPKVQNIISFNGSFGCGYCLHPNTKFTIAIPDSRKNGNDQDEPVFQCKKKLRYLISDEKYSLRTDSELRNHMDLAERSNFEHIYGAKGRSVLNTLPYFNVVYGLPVDYMHAVLLGAVKRLANLWFDSTSHDKDYYLGRKVDEVDERIKNISVTSKMRYTLPISDRVHWKARMWRDFLLYYGLPSLANILPDMYYAHFRKLCSAIYTLLRESVTFTGVNEASNLLQEFVTEYQALYGEVNMVYNIHLLTHLAMMVSRLGPLWAYSLFSFESGNGQLLKLVKGTRGVATQIAKKYLMTQSVEKLLRNHYQSSDCVLDFCSDVIGFKYVKHVSKLQNVVLFEQGTVLNLDDEQQEVLQSHKLPLTVKINSFRKALVKGILYKSFKLSRQIRKNDSCVHLTDGTYGMIEYIVQRESDVLCFVRSINIASDVSATFPTHIKRCCLDPYGDLKLVNIKEIETKCIFMSCNGQFYIGEFCNTYEKE